ncbi:MAG: hypothetical protein KIT11_04825 [Fimbriimonadaceae bacterium]|nr:hypothetical protein [Fimbriimonadaceae bacterium]QYK56782.1 MAG: hypothetical protein KF733_04695 [Fimbriimonadaceae bacterium]
MLAAAVVAPAQDRFIEGARGAGVLVNANREATGEFMFTVARFVREGTELVQGNLAYRGRSESGPVQIEGRAMRLAINSRTLVAEFTGPAVAVVNTNSGLRRFEGTYSVRVQDRRVFGVGDPDTFAVTFTSREFQYSTRGLVGRGDLVVRAPHSVIAN